jgi:CRP/FNR family transcriptional regulator
MISSAQFEALAGFFPVLQELPDALRESVMGAAVPFQMKVGTVAFDTYAACDSFPLLTEGRIRVAKPAPNGREILLYRVEPGQTCVLTLNCLLSDVEYGARGVVSRDCTGAAIPRSMFLRLVDAHPGFREFVFRSLSRRVLELMELIEEVAFNRLDQRIAKLLVSASGNGNVKPIEKTHQQIADELGSVREIVSRILGSFADSGMVQLERGRISVVDPDGLQKVSERG